MNTNPKTSMPLACKAARLSMIAPLVAFALLLCCVALNFIFGSAADQFEEIGVDGPTRAALTVLPTLSVIVAVCGLVLGASSLFAAGKNTTESVMMPALTGVVLSFCYLATYAFIVFAVEELIKYSA